MSILQEHGWIRLDPNGVEINGVWHRVVWHVAGN